VNSSGITIVVGHTPLLGRGFRSRYKRSFRRTSMTRARGRPPVHRAANIVVQVHTVTSCPKATRFFHHPSSAACITNIVWKRLHGHGLSFCGPHRDGTVKRTNLASRNVRVETAPDHSSKARRVQTIAMKTNFVYGTDDAAHAKLAASFGSPVPA
jgi:hypothetical protein